MPSISQILLAELLVLGLLISATSAQNFHFSNGWLPGKRSQNTENNVCSFRPHVKALIMRIIEDEVQRIERCMNPGYGDLLSLIQNKRSDMPQLTPVITDN